MSFAQVTCNCIVTRNQALELKTVVLKIVLLGHEEVVLVLCFNYFLALVLRFCFRLALFILNVFSPWPLYIWF